MLKFAPYSHSKMSCYQECPRKFKFAYIDKIKVFKDKPYFEKGKWFHYCLEYYPKPTPKPYQFKWPENVVKVDKFVGQLKEILAPGTEISDLLLKYSLRREFTFYFDENVKPQSKKAGAMMTGIIDYVGQKEPGTLIIADWKSGKSKVKDDGQVKLYALWGFSAAPNINEITCGFYYLESGEKHEVTFERSQYDDLVQDCINKIDRIESDEEFPRKTNSRCQWCDYFDHCKPHQVKTSRGE